MNGARRDGNGGGIERGAHFAFILSSSASYFFCSSALAVVRFLILSS